MNLPYILWQSLCSPRRLVGCGCPAPLDLLPPCWLSGPPWKFSEDLKGFVPLWVAVFLFGAHAHVCIYGDFTIMMVNLMCVNLTGHDVPPDETLFVGVSVKVFPNGMSIWISRLSKVDCPLKLGGHYPVC